MEIDFFHKRYTVNRMDILFAAILGLVLGSFNACYIYRSIAPLPLPAPTTAPTTASKTAYGATFGAARSSCPSCGKTLRVLHLIPVFSYLFLGGRCGYCKASISPLYALIECVTALLAVGLMLKVGIGAVFFVYFLALSVMLVGSVIDYYTYILPDACTVGALCTIIPLGIFFDVFTLEAAAYGALFGGGTASLLYVYFRYVRKKIALGLGDVKYLFFLGALVGLEAISLMYFISASLGIVYIIALRLRYGKDYAVWQTAIPFGPFLSVAAAVLLFWKL